VLTVSEMHPGWNYVYGNPVNLTDESGKFPPLPDPPGRPYGNRSNQIGMCVLLGPIPVISGIYATEHISIVTETQWREYTGL
jgi:uncharacterized membrane protein